MGQEDYIKFLQLHESQLQTSGIPQHFWQYLHIKLKNQIFDANDTFALLKIDYEDEGRSPEDPLFILQIKCEEGINYNDSKHIYLVDHAWTFRLNDAKQQLLHMPNLLDRMCNIMGIESENIIERTDKVCEFMWKYIQTYSVANAANVEDRLPVWYVMDEVGCGVQHSDDANFRAVPFLHIPEQVTYTLLFPVKDAAFEDQVTRDFAEGISDGTQRKSQLMPWVKTDFSDIDFSQTEPDENYFLSGHIEESLPTGIECEHEVVPEKIKVFSEYIMVNNFLTHPRFEITDDESSADILWYTRHFKQYATLNSNRFVNQFPFENVLTIKDLLSIVCRRNSQSYDKETLETFPEWFPTTYNLKTELPKFISYYQNRAQLCLDNHWICKPWNLARGLDTHITNNLDYIVRLSATGPKIAQKYIHNPVLFDRPECGKVKFDIRYVILLKSVHPLKAYIYNNFFLRFSNKPFEMNNFEDYEKHFTVMNYNEETILHHLPCADFLTQWDEQFSDFPWRDIEEKIIKMLKTVFENATNVEPPRGIATSPQSRAVYAADIMLSWDSPHDGTLPYMQPKLLEINWTPDCKRACDYYPNFYNDIFSCLFLNDESSNSFTCL